MVIWEKEDDGQEREKEWSRQKERILKVLEEIEVNLRERKSWSQKLTSISGSLDRQLPQIYAYATVPVLSDPQKVKSYWRKQSELLRSEFDATYPWYKFSRQTKKMKKEKKLKEDILKEKMVIEMRQ